MNRWTTLRAAAALAATLVAGPAPRGSDQDEGSPAPAPRVIVEVSRHEQWRGTVPFEDEEMIFLRSAEGTLRRFLKHKVRRIVRLVDPAPGQRGTVHLRDDSIRRGVILEDGFDAVLMEIEGIRARLPRGQVERVVLEPPFQVRYEKLKASITSETPLRHMALCRWLVREHRYELALAELQDLVDHDPLPEARALETLVKAQLALPGHAPGDAGTASPADPALPGDLIGLDAVNLIRIYEIDFDRPPKISIPPAAIRQLIETHRDDPIIPTGPGAREKLFSMEPIDVLREYFFPLRARELYGQVTVLTEPFALNVFRQRVHNAWLMNTCATRRCHGGPDAGRLFLYRASYRDPRVRYTNLLILNRLVIDPDWPLVNYETPMNSLIIQYGLPRPHARRPHPQARGWRPAFRGPDDRMVSNTLRWIQAMLRPRVRYPIAFEPPRLERAAGAPSPGEPSPDHPSR